MTSAAIVGKLGFSTHEGKMLRLWEARSGRRLGARLIKDQLLCCDVGVVGAPRSAFDATGSRTCDHAAARRAAARRAAARRAAAHGAAARRAAARRAAAHRARRHPSHRPGARRAAACGCGCACGGAQWWSPASVGRTSCQPEWGVLS